MYSISSLCATLRHNVYLCSQISNYMAKLGYWQEAEILRCSSPRSCADHGKETGCVYLELDVSARNANTRARLNVRYLCVRVINKKLISMCQFLEYPAMARLRLCASGYRDRAQANRLTAAIDVYELIILDDNGQTNVSED